MNQGRSDRPMMKWTERRLKGNDDADTESIVSADEDLSRYHDHTDPEEDLEAWSREVAEEEDFEEDPKQILSTSILSTPESVSNHETKQKKLPSQRKLQLGEVNPQASTRAKADTKKFHAQITKAKNQLADLIQDKSELRQRLAAAIQEAGKQSRKVKTMETTVQGIRKKNAVEVENITAVASNRADMNQEHLQQKNHEISVLRALLLEKESQHTAILQQKKAVSTTALQMLKETRAAQTDLKQAQDGEHVMLQQLWALERKLREQSVAHEEEIVLAKDEAKKLRQAMGVMEERHGAAISGLMEQIVTLKRKAIGPEVEERQRQMADHIIFLEHECAEMREAIGAGKLKALSILEEKEAVEDEARRLREERRRLLQEGRRVLQERDAEVAIVTEQLRMVLVAKEGESSTIVV